MNKLTHDVLSHLHKFLTFREIIASRSCNTYLNNQITYIMFLKKPIDIEKIPRKSMHKFIDFVRKYKLYLDIINLRGMMQLAHFQSTDEYEMHPKVLRSISFDESFNNELKSKLPENTVIVSFRTYFDRALIPGYFPNTLTKLDFSASRFNQELKPNDLPPNLTELIFGSEFNIKIQIGVLPEKLTSINFGYSFNQPLELGVFPKSLTHLKFGYEFNQPLIVGILPIGLTYLYFGDDFDKEILPGVIPNTLQVLRIGPMFSKKINKDNIPIQNLQHILCQNGFYNDKEFTADQVFEHFSKN